MTPESLYELFRLEADDLAEPYLWTDFEFLTYLNEAHDLHISEIGGIADRTSSFTKLTYKAGDQFLKFDPRIIRIKGAWDENNRRLSIKNLDNFEDGFTTEDYGSRVNAGFDDGRTGPIEAIVTDVEDDKLQLYPIPDATGYVQLYVFRGPLVDVEDSFEIPPQYHLNLLNWVKYKAYSKQDVETFDGKKAAEFRSEFTTGLDRAVKNKGKRQDRKRIVSYGGIPMS